MPGPANARPSRFRRTAASLLASAFITFAPAAPAAPPAGGGSGLLYCCNDSNGKQVCGDILPQACYGRAYREIGDGARTDAANILGAPGDGWKVAMGLLGFERGVSTLAQQMGFRNELNAVIAAARANCAAQDPLTRQRIAKAEIGLKLMRYGALRMLTDAEGGKLDPAALTYKIQWATWRRDLGELAMDVLGQAGETVLGGDYAFPALPNLFLYSRADTIYGGTNEIQRNIIAERALGLPREPRGDLK